MYEVEQKENKIDELPVRGTYTHTHPKADQQGTTSDIGGP